MVEMVATPQTALQEQVDRILGVGFQASLQQQYNASQATIFSEFVTEDVVRAKEITQKMGTLADGALGIPGLQDALDFLEQTQKASHEKPGLCQYALKRFIIHYPGAQPYLRIPSLEKRQPNQARPSPP